MMSLRSCIYRRDRLEHIHTWSHYSCSLFRSRQLADTSYAVVLDLTPGCSSPPPGGLDGIGSSVTLSPEDRELVLIEEVLDDEDASAPSSPQRTTPASGVDTFLVHSSAPSPSSSLSPLTSPFHPGDGSMGHPKARLWADEDLDDSDAERSPVSSPTSYLDVVRQGS
jgi:hypothetical protein